MFTTKLRIALTAAALVGAAATAHAKPRRVVILPRRPKLRVAEGERRVAGKAKDLGQGAALATKSIESGEAEGRLDRLIAVSNAVEA